MEPRHEGASTIDLLAQSGTRGDIVLGLRPEWLLQSAAKEMAEKIGRAHLGELKEAKAW